MPQVCKYRLDRPDPFAVDGAPAIRVNLLFHSLRKSNPGTFNFSCKIGNRSCLGALRISQALGSEMAAATGRFGAFKPDGMLALGKGVTAAAV